MKKLSIVIMLVIVALFHHSVSFSQNKEDDKTNVNLSNDFQDLEEQRLATIAEMYSMMYEISGLFTELERAQSLEKLTEDYTHGNIDTSSMSEEMKTQLKRLNEIKEKIVLPELKSINGADLQNMKSMKVTEGFRRIIENKVQAILKKTDKLSSLGTKVTELNNTSYVSQNFKKQISWSFALLVGIVIVGFFLIAYKDESIRDTIFSGDVGLQFVTIFSIIIAIILFGITEVLGGKEIAALIGGISGYILGRSRGASKQKVTDLEQKLSSIENKITPSNSKE